MPTNSLNFPKQIWEMSYRHGLHLLKKKKKKKSETRMTANILKTDLNTKERCLLVQKNAIY